jgi:Rrf2 family iron-sulfur cluster assembly transcriptional regulator
VDESVDTTRCGGAHNCQNNQRCLTHDLWHDLSERIYEYLNRISLRDLVDRAAVQEVARRQDTSPPPQLGEDMLRVMPRRARA